MGICGSPAKHTHTHLAQAKSGSPLPGLFSAPDPLQLLQPPVPHPANGASYLQATGGAVRARRKALLPSRGSGARASPFQAGLLHCRPSCMGLGHLCWGAGLGTVGCLGASLASTWPTPVAPPPPCTCENKDVSEHGQMFPSGAKPHPDGRARHIVSRCSEMSRSSTLKSQALQVHVYTSPPGIAEVPRDKMGALSPPISISLSPHTPSKHTILEFLNLRTAG